MSVAIGVIVAIVAIVLAVTIAVIGIVAIGTVTAVPGAHSPTSRHAVVRKTPR